MLFVGIVLAVVAMPLAAGAQGAAQPASRIHLLASDAGRPYWSVDRTDPELDSGPIVNVSGPTLGVTTQRFSQISFMPATVFTNPVTFGPDAPLRFHVALEVTAAGPYDVVLELQKGPGRVTSAPASQVSPGVFEGTLAAPGTLVGDGTDMLVVRVTSMSPVHRMELATGGASWVDLPAPAAAFSVPQLIARSPRPAQPQVYTSATRTVTLNDGAWEARTFTGTLDAERTFAFVDSRPASAVLAWLDLPDTPPLTDALSGRAPNPATVANGPTLLMNLDGAWLDNGQRAVTAASTPGGEYTLKVGRSAASQSTPYTLHVLTVYGQRTLQQMRWRFPAPHAAYTAMGGTCGSYQGVPTTSAVTTFVVDVDAASANPLSRDAWVPTYSIPGVGESPCGEADRGSEIRFITPRIDHRWRIGAAPMRRDIPVVSASDTILELDVRWAYEPPAAP